MGRTANKPAAAADITVETPPLPAEQILSNQNLAAQVAASLTEERDLLNQLLGQAQMADAISKFSRTVRLSKLAYVRENKLYKVLAGKQMPNGSACKGTWEEFCNLLGYSKDKIDLDIQNFQAFGEEALESMSRMGIGYRELRQFRKLPDDQKTALIEVAQSGDKESFLDLAEEIIAKHTKEKSTLQSENASLKADLEARSKVLADTSNKVSQLKTDIAKLQEQKRLIEPPTPDERGKALCLETMRITKLIEGQIRGDLHNACKALTEHDEQTGSDHQPLLTGLVCQLELALNQLRGTYFLGNEPSGETMPAWLTDEAPVDGEPS